MAADDSALAVLDRAEAEAGLQREEIDDRLNFDGIVFEIASAPDENIELIRVGETVEAPKVDGEPTAEKSAGD